MTGFAGKQVDPAILARARRGDMKAHEIIFRTFSGAVFTLAARVTGSRAAADDVLQETFVEILRSLENFREEASLATWIRSIAVSKSLMHLRSAWLRRVTFLGDSEDEASPLPALTTPGETRQFQLGRDLEQALAKLSAVSRAVVILHDVEGYTHEEIAELMSKTPSFSKSQLSRAHARLRELLGDAFGEEKKSGAAATVSSLDAS